MSKRSLGLVVCLWACLMWPVPAPAADVGSFKRVHVNDIDIAFQDFGTGDPIVMIMGYGGSMDLWSRRLLQLLAESHHIFIFDNRGMGHSTSTEAEYSIPLFAEDTLGFMDACGLAKVTLLGWSMGAQIALEAAISHPERVGSLILISGAPGGREQIRPSAEVLEKLTDCSEGSLARGLHLIELLFPQSWRNGHPYVWTYFPVNATMNPPERSLAQLHAILDWSGCWSRLPDMALPALIITGDEDVVFPTQNSMLLAKGIRNSRLIRFPEGGHGVMYQYPDKVAEEINSFLNEKKQ